MAFSFRGITDRVKRVLQRPGTVNLAPYRALLSEVEERAEEIKDLSDEKLADAFADLKGYIDEGLDVRADVCALGREAAERGIGERPYDVQLIGALAMMDGNVAEMATGEGKTLTAVLAAAGFHVQGKRVHVLTVNDYLARRDAEWMGPIYQLLGMSVAYVIAGSSPEQRREAYKCDVTYVTATEAGFDYLRDHLVTSVDDIVQQPFDTAIVDEADSLLVDEARVPLVLGGSVAHTDDTLASTAELVRGLKPGLHYRIEDDGRNVQLTDAGAAVVEEILGAEHEANAEVAEKLAETDEKLLEAAEKVAEESVRSANDEDDDAKAEAEADADADDDADDEVEAEADEEPEPKRFNLYAPENLPRLTAINLALHAEALLRRDVDYIVRDGKVRLVNEFRGRIAELQRWPDGLQAAVEAKEALASTDAGEVLSNITMQALLKLYGTVCGMTGTAVPAAEELREFYNLEVAVIPLHRENVRIDEPDRVYASLAEKETAAIDEVKKAHEDGRPVLIGTLDVAESERLGQALADAGLECSVLNAKNDAEEARIIAEAGTYGAITVSTQIAGRGVDIRLGGSDQTDRDRIVELGGLYIIGVGRHESRRVDNQLRGRAGRQGDPGESVFFVSVNDNLVQSYGRDALPPPQLPDEDGQLRDPALQRAIEHAQRVSEGVFLQIHRNTWRYNYLIEQQRQVVHSRRDDVLRTPATIERLEDRCGERYDELVKEFDLERVTEAARQIELYHLDRAWADHLATLSDIREGVHLRALGRLDPLDEFHREAIPAFEQMLAEVEEKVEKTFTEVPFDSDGKPELEEVGLTRATTTWTYVIKENPFGSEWERALQTFRRRA
ncbi:DEAD/DEAH box helicase [Fodinicola acaciae]|uniref:preprotein translocase subunit SecA n=1 Tax=Fodinicola acaciae TaxID=2681555 RepID=UPI0013D18C34|nr:DEAD/DEAH box helicase [Fodinicola acaciae]